MKPRWLALPLLLLMATCAREDMFDQQRDAPWSTSSFLRDHMTMQAPVAGSIARNAPDTAVAQPATITAAMLTRGQQRFAINCVPCHGQSGDGLGMIVQRGFPRPPALFSDDLIKAKAQHFYDVITNGHGVMYSYADRVSPADRWAIVAYIRALQRSQRAQVASLPARDQQDLKAAEP
jgi:mono/diheme cytochrome c family protein